MSQVTGESVSLLLVGRDGNGKSSTGNSILCDKKHFTPTSSSLSDGLKIEQASAAVGNDREVIVTEIAGLEYPGSYYTGNFEDTLRIIEETIEKNTEGFDAVIFVLKYGTGFTKREKDALLMIKSIFGFNVLTKFGVIVMTCGDSFELDVEEDNQTFDEWCRAQTGDVKTLFEDCDYRCVLFNNSTKDAGKMKEQRKKLFSLVKLIPHSYTLNEYREAVKGQTELLVQTQLPQLEKEKNMTMGEVWKDLTEIDQELSLQSCNILKLSSSLKNIKKKLLHLKKKLQDEDKNTGVLKHLFYDISIAEMRIDTKFKIAEQRLQLVTSSGTWVIVTAEESDFCLKKITETVSIRKCSLVGDGKFSSTSFSEKDVPACDIVLLEICKTTPESQQVTETSNKLSCGEKVTEVFGKTSQSKGRAQEDAQGHGRQEEVAQVQGHGRQEEVAQVQGHGTQGEVAKVQGHGTQGEVAQAQGHGTQIAQIQCHGTQVAQVQGHDTQVAQAQGHGTQIVQVQGRGTQVAQVQGHDTQLAQAQGHSTQVVQVQGHGTQVAQVNGIGRLEDVGHVQGHGTQVEVTHFQGHGTQVAQAQGHGIQVSQVQGHGPLVALVQGHGTQVAQAKCHGRQEEVGQVQGHGTQVEVTQVQGRGIQVVQFQGHSTQVVQVHVHVTQVVQVLGHATQVVQVQGNDTQVVQVPGHDTQIVQPQGHGTQEEVAQAQGHGTQVEVAQAQGYSTHVEVAQAQSHGTQEAIAQTQGHGTQVEVAQGQGHDTQEEVTQAQGHGRRVEVAQGQGHGRQVEVAQAQGHGRQVEVAQDQGHGRQLRDNSQTSAALDHTGHDKSDDDFENTKITFEKISKILKTYYFTNALCLISQYKHKLTKQEIEAVLKMIKETYGTNRVKNQSILILICDNDNLEVENDQMFKNWCQEKTGSNKRLLDLCGKRCVLLNPWTKDERVLVFQKKRLLDSVADLDTRNTSKNYGIDINNAIKTTKSANPESQTVFQKAWSLAWGKR